jgi:integrase
MNRRKKLPLKKHESLCIYCNKCKKHFFWTQKNEKQYGGKIKMTEPDCGETSNKFSKCPNFEKHKFRSRFHIPGSNMSRVSKTFDVTTYQDAVVKAIEFRKSFMKDTFAVTTEPNKIKKTGFLFDVQIEYLNFLDNVDVPEHQKIHRSDKHISEQSKSLEQFNEVLSKKGINKKVLPIHKITDTHVGYFHSYLTKDHEYANKTYNKKISTLKSFYQWAIETYDLPNKNPFLKVKPRSTKKNNDTITEREYYDLVDPKNMCKENGEITIGIKRKLKRNLYRDYLKDGIELCLHTGGRREEVVELKWNMIHTLNNEMYYIEFNNLKVERMLGDGFNDNVKTNIIPITQDLKDLLLRLGYNQCENSDNYILCPDRSNQSTETIMDNISKGFTHFYKRLNTGRELQLKCLRKTYMTYLKFATNDDMKKLDSHTTDEILNKHYLDASVINRAISEMRIFGK